MRVVVAAGLLWVVVVGAAGPPLLPSHPSSPNRTSSTKDAWVRGVRGSGAVHGKDSQQVVEYSDPFITAFGTIFGVVSMSGRAVGLDPSDFPSLYAYVLFNSETWGVPAQPLGRSISNNQHLSLIVAFTALSSSIPSQIGLLQDLVLLRLKLNDQLTGTLPSQLGVLSKLADLHLFNNRLRGPIPTQLGLATNLLALTLTQDPFTGLLPSQFGNLTLLGSLVVDSTSLGGQIPSQLALLPRLSILELSNSGFSGTIPRQLGGATALETIDFGSNRLEGDLPTGPELGRLSRLRVLHCHDNNLGGTIPTQIGLLASLENLGVGGNSLSGTLPSQLFALSSLTRISLRDNLLEGQIPSQVGHSPNLRFVSLANNRLSSLPSEIALLPAISVSVEGNLIRGRVPSQLGGMQQLRELWLQHNRLWGGVPSQLARAAQLKHLALSGNDLSGSLPTELGLLASLTALELSDNQLSGELPTQLGLLSLLLWLDVGHNAFSGTLPPAVLALPLVVAATVEANRLHGSVPPSLATGFVWLAECDNSGLRNSECEYDCPRCGGEWVRLKRCDWKGEGSWCVSVWVLVGVSAGVAVALAAAVRALNPRLRWGKVAFRTVLGVYSVAGTLLEYLFAVNSEGAIQVAAYTAIGVMGGMSLGVGVWVVRRHRALHHPLATAAMGLLCALDIGAVKIVLPSDDTSFLASLLMMACSFTDFGLRSGLQLTSVLAGNTSTLNLLALSVSLCSLAVLVTIFGVVMLPCVRGVARLVRDTSRVHELKTVAAKSREAIKRSRARIAAAGRGGGGGGGGDDAGSSAGAGAGGRGRTRRVWLLGLVCCCAVVGMAAHGSRREQGVAVQPATAVAALPAPHRTAPDAATFDHRPWRQPTGRKARVKAEDPCAQSTAVVEFLYEAVCFFGVTFVLHDLVGPVASDVLAAATQTQMLIVLDRGEAFPSEVGLLTNLRLAALAWDYDRVPTELGSLSQLSALSLQTSQFIMPSQIGSLSHLTFWHCQCANELAIASQVGLLIALETLWLFDGTVDHPYPSQLGQLTNLQSLRLTGHITANELPTQLGKLSRLVDFQLQRSTLRGVLPSQLAAMTQLTAVSISRTALRGSIPGPWLASAGLTSFQVWGNHVTGTIPTTIPPTSNLTVVDLGGNLLTGSIPSQLGLATRLTRLSLHNNRLSGPIPSQLGLLARLTALHLFSQFLSGTLPPALGNAVLLRLLEVSNNALVGEVPPQMGRLTALTRVALDNNAMSEGLPEGLDRGVWLQSCDMSGLDERACARKCPGCSLNGLLVKSCNKDGYGQVCVPLFGLLVGVGVVALLAHLALHRTHKRKVVGRNLAAGALFSTIAGVHFAMNIAFARSVDGNLALFAFLLVGMTVVSRIVLCANDHFRKESSDNLVANYKNFAVGAVCCVVDPFMLRLLSGDTQSVVVRAHHSRSSRFAVHTTTNRIAMVATWISDVPMLVVQALALEANTRPRTIQALVITAISAVAACRVLIHHSGTIVTSVVVVENNNSDSNEHEQEGNQDHGDPDAEQEEGDDNDDREGQGDGDNADQREDGSHRHQLEPHRHSLLEGIRRFSLISAGTASPL